MTTDIECPKHDKPLIPDGHAADGWERFRCQNMGCGIVLEKPPTPESANLRLVGISRELEQDHEE